MLTLFLAVLKKPLQTSISVSSDEFGDIDVEDKLHIVISVKDFRAIIQHAGIAGSELFARYSLPAKPIQFSYSSDAISSEFLIMTVGERGSNPGQKTRKGRKAAPQPSAPRLEPVSRRTSVAPSQAPDNGTQIDQQPAPPAASFKPPASNPARPMSTARASASRMSAFDLRPSQRPPPPTLRSESLFIDDEGWEPVQDEDDEAEENGRLDWDHSAVDPDQVRYLLLKVRALLTQPDGLLHDYEQRRAREDGGRQIRHDGRPPRRSAVHVPRPDTEAFRCTRAGSISRLRIILPSSAGDADPASSAAGSNTCDLRLGWYIF